jgi:hypothetical protein
MNVLMSKVVREPFFRPFNPPAVCIDQLIYIRYGLGNFSGFVEFITCYLNWYDPKSGLSHSTIDSDDGRKDYSEDSNSYRCFQFLSDDIVKKLDYSIQFKVRGPPVALLTLKICFLRFP